MAVGIDHFASGTTTLDADERAAFAAGLREVDTATWRASLPRDADPDVLAAPRLFDEPLAG